MQRTIDKTIDPVTLHEQSIDSILEKEWLLTNGRGGYSSSTIVGCNTRRYHGLLVGSINPPVNRIMALANCLEQVIIDKEIFNLSTIEFDNKFAPEGFCHIKKFHKDIGVHFDYETDKFKMTKSVYLLRDSDTVAVVYDFKKIKRTFDFISRPFVGLRNFHALQKSYAQLCVENIEEGILVRHETHGSCRLIMGSKQMNFENDPHWWFNFTYRCDRERGQDFAEDLWTPGFFKRTVESPSKIVLWGNLNPCSLSQLTYLNIEDVCEDLRRHQRQLISPQAAKDKKLRTLFLAAEQFVTQRGVKDSSQTDTKKSTTIMAGYPWFADWGRDAFISLPGLLLETNRFEQAKSVLTTFANAVDKGMIPNRFDDQSSEVHFNSIDSSLWFINAAFQYLNYTEDIETFSSQLLPSIRWVIDSYQNGTRYGIHADTDGLIAGGDERTQLTWMDAKCDGVAFTPRYGKAVEINALWYNALCQLAQYYTERDTDAAKHYHTLADKVESSFQTVFWNETTGYLNDCVLSNGSIDTALRPNQIFAVSLPFSPLSAEQRKSVVKIVQENLLTDFGLRTLNDSDSNYQGRYTGEQKLRDNAYHQGTVWPFLIGSFVESYLKVNDFSKKSKRDASEFIAPLLRHLTKDACIGSISEIFDGDSPQKPKGCFAQAWSIAELIRAYKMINS